MKFLEFSIFGKKNPNILQEINKILSFEISVLEKYD